MQEVQKIEGISPDMLWTFMVVLVGLMALVVLGHKVIEIFRKEHERKESRAQLQGQDITDRIANKVMEKLEPKINEKFDEIDRRLTNDRRDIEDHTAQLSDIEARTKKLDDSNKALCHGIFALLGHEINGNSVDKLKKAHDAMRDYLIDGEYKEDAWQ